jgi:ABC-2 type transport system ATP-binding protein
MTSTTRPAAGADPAIVVTDLHRTYGAKGRRFEAVRGVDLTVRRGELFALLGTNGAGKTSALELIEGLARPSGGSVRVLGHDPYADARKVRPQLGMMLQESGFPAGLTVAEVMRMWAGTLTAARPIDEALDLVRLRDRRDVVVRSLSGGERRRLDLAVAVLGRPAVLFLDEPTTGLDPESRHAAWELIGDLLGAGTTVLLTTHYLEEAERLADRIAIMHAGRIVTSGTLAEIVAGQPAVVSFRLDGAGAADLPELPGAWVRQEASSAEGSRVVIETDQLQATLHRLLGWAADGRTLTDLDARSASLEQAFLAVAQLPTEQPAADQEALA